MDRIKSFDEVFEQKLLRIKKKIKRELDKAPKERNKDFVKVLIKEAKSLRKALDNVV